MCLESLGMVAADGMPAAVLAVPAWHVFPGCFLLPVQAVPALSSRQRSLLTPAVSSLCSLCRKDLCLLGFSWMKGQVLWASGNETNYLSLS